MTGIILGLVLGGIGGVIIGVTVGACCAAAHTGRDADLIETQAEQIELLHRQLRQAEAQLFLDGRSLAHHIDRRGYR